MALNKRQWCLTLGASESQGCRKVEAAAGVSVWKLQRKEKEGFSSFSVAKMHFVLFVALFAKSLDPIETRSHVKEM